VRSSPFRACEDGSFYAVADYRLRHGTLPLGWVAMLAQPSWAIVIALIVLALLLFPDGKLAFPRLRWVLWLYLVFGLLWMGGAYGITLRLWPGVRRAGRSTAEPGADAGPAARVAGRA